MALDEELILLRVAPRKDEEVLRGDEPDELLEPGAGEGLAVRVLCTGGGGRRARTRGGASEQYGDKGRGASGLYGEEEGGGGGDEVGGRGFGVWGAGLL